MIRQPSKPDKMYSVEVFDNAAKGNNLIVANPCVYAQKPSDAVIYAMNQEGYGRSRANVSPYDGKSNTS